jgi:hypothetical protein
VKRILDATIVLLAAVILLILALGGVDYSWGIARVRLHDWGRPLALLAAAVVARGVLGTRGGAKVGALGTYVATVGLVALLLAAAAIAATYQVRVCGGLDSYGYVSTASLMASGHLSEPQPLVPLIPFERASNAAAPLGYIAGVDGHTQVPRFPIGLPLVMALFKIAFGLNGPFFVPLVMAYAAIALAFLLASGAWRWPSGQQETLTGLFAAVLVAIDPLFVDYAIQPMSDVPAACWLLAALWLSLRPSTCARDAEKTGPASRQYVDGAILAGVCAGMAFLTRPALLLAAITIGVVTLDRSARDLRSRGARQALRFSVTLALFVALQMALNTVLYGNARLSGYGPASYMFDISGPRLAANASNFGKWLTYSHTFLFWALWPGALIVLHDRKWAWQLSAVAAAAAFPYLFYLVFDDWESPRFLLPTILLILILAATAISHMLLQLQLSWCPVFAGPILLLVIALICAAASHRFLQREGVDRLREVEAKYALTGEWIRAHTTERAVVLAGLHSGSIRLYGGRQTIRWDEIPSDKLSATLHNLEAAGYQPYLALDLPSEPPLFADRFRADPAVRIEQIGRVRVVNIYRFVSAH